MEEFQDRMDENLHADNMDELRKILENYNCSVLDQLSEIYLDNYTSLDTYVNCTVGGNMFEGEESQSKIPRVVTFIMMFFYAIIFICGIIGNTAVIYVVHRYSKMQTVTNIYLVNLAIADILFLMGLPFLLTTTLLGYWIFGNIPCKFYMIATLLNQFTSSLFLTIMSADRYLAVCHPVCSPKYRTSIVSYLVSLSAWTISSFMIVPVFMYSSTFEIHSQQHCNMFWPSSSSVSGQTIFTLYALILSFIIPFVLIFIFYLLVIRKLCDTDFSSRSIARKKSQKKVTRMVLALIIVYLICYLPYWALQVSLSFRPPKQAHPPSLIILFLISSLLSYVNSSLNPLLYVFLSDNFKKSFKKIFNYCLCCCPGCDKGKSSHHLQTNSKRISIFKTKSLRSRMETATGVAGSAEKEKKLVNNSLNSVENETNPTRSSSQIVHSYSSQFLFKRRKSIRESEIIHMKEPQMRPLCPESAEGCIIAFKSTCI